MALATDTPRFNAPDFDVFSPARRRDPRGVMLGTPLDGGQSYVPWIGLSTVRELALKHSDRVGLVDAEHLDQALNIIVELKDRVLELEGKLAESEAQNDRIAGLAARGFKVVKVQGRPPKRAEENGNG